MVHLAVTKLKNAQTRLLSTRAVPRPRRFKFLRCFKTILDGGAVFVQCDVAVVVEITARHYAEEMYANMIYISHTETCRLQAASSFHLAYHAAIFNVH